MSTTLLVPPPTPVKPRYKIPKWLLERRTAQRDFEQKLAAPPSEYRPSYWRNYATSRCAFCPSEITDQRFAYQGKVCAMCACRYGLGWPAVPALRERCQTCDAPFGQGEREGRWTFYVIDDYFNPDRLLCPVCWRRGRFPEVESYLRFHTRQLQSEMRWSAAWAFHACRESENVAAHALNEFGCVRNYAVKLAADTAWCSGDKILLELIRFADVAPRLAANAFVDEAKSITAGLEGISVAQQHEILKLIIDESQT